MNYFKNGMALLMLGIGGPLLAQSFGEIHGKVVDENGAPAEFVSVAAEQGQQHYGTETDSDGSFVLKPLPAGTYDLTVTAMGKDKKVITGVRVDPDLINTLPTIQVGSMLGTVDVIAWKDPLIRKDDPARITITPAMIEKNAVRKDPVKMISQLTGGGVYKAPNSDELYFRGSRAGAMAYYVDGVKVTGHLTGVNSNAIAAVNVYTGGLPAKYGDVTGGVVAIETKSYFDLYQQRNAENH